MAISVDQEVMLRLQNGLEGQVTLDMTQEPEAIVQDVLQLLSAGLGGNTKGLQYLHPMGDWRELPWEQIELRLKDHIHPPLRRAQSTSESTYISPEEVVAFSERRTAKPTPWNKQPIGWTLVVHFTEQNRLGEGTAFYDGSGFKTTQKPGDYTHPHTLRIRQLVG